MTTSVVIPVCAGRESNLELVLDRLGQLELNILVVVDGGELTEWKRPRERNVRYVWNMLKHKPGREQPRNVGVKVACRLWSETTHVWFLDSDVLPSLEAPDALAGAIASEPGAIQIAPYDWLPSGLRPAGIADENFWLQAGQVRNDPRWAMFDTAGSGPFMWDLSKGLACFSGNLVWPVEWFKRVGGFWNELHHGRAEDGELGLRAVALGVPICLAPRARGYHLHHDVNLPRIYELNAIDVPKINARHPWLLDASISMVEREGAAFDVRCSECGEQVPTGNWWGHADSHS